MRRVLDAMFRKLVVAGRLEVTYSDGQRHIYGDGGPPCSAIRFTDPAAERRIAIDPELAVGEAYMDGHLVIEQGSVYDLLDVVMQGSPSSRAPLTVLAHRGWRYLRRRWDQRNTKPRASRNVAHHYDLDGRLYSLFLDSDRQYSCAYFETPDVSLEEAQLAKKRHLAAKLLVEPGQRVLDIGSGWGGLALYLAETCGADVTGVTLSREQEQASRARAIERGLENRVAFRLEDYRNLDERFDRIVSVGMFEHVGVGRYGEFFSKVAGLLGNSGVMVLHSIGRIGKPGSTNPWIDKYIFPGGYIPALSEVFPAIQNSGLIVTDIEILRLHYAETLKAWRERFLKRIDEARRIYDERFCRMWEFYLAGSECAFRHEEMMVFQVQLARRQDAVPLNRNYIGQAERRLRAKERRAGPPMRLAGE